MRGVSGVNGATEVVAVESAFAVPLVDQATGAVLDRDLVGSLDLVERDAEGRLVVVDLKTAARKYTSTSVRPFVLPPDGLDDKFAPPGLDRIQHSPVTPHPDPADILLSLYLVVSGGPGIRLEAQDRPHHGEEGGVIVDVEEFLLRPAADSEPHRARALFRRARRASISRMGNASMGSRRRVRTSV